MTLKRIFNRTSGTEPAGWRRRIDERGIVLGLRSDGDAVSLDAVDALLAQLRDDGLLEQIGSELLIPWEAAYELERVAGYQGVLAALGLAKKLPLAPILESYGSLSDASFSIAANGWLHQTSRQRVQVSRHVGAHAAVGDAEGLLPEQSWRLLELVRGFAERPAAERNEVSNRRLWGVIRRGAVACHAGMDAFLVGSIVLTPDRLQLELRKSETDSRRLVEVAPTFEGAPAGWLATFDRHGSVRERYDIATPEGIVQVVVLPAVGRVLEEIKRMPGRRAVGARAEAFLVNPFAALGDEAGEVLDPAQIEEARLNAGITLDRFTVRIKRDATGHVTRIGLFVESLGAVTSHGEEYWFQSDDEAKSFVRGVRENLARQLQLAAWRGFDFELNADSSTHLDAIEAAVEARASAAFEISKAKVYDLSAYAARIEGIGFEKPYYSPAIAKGNEDDPWVPQNLVPIIWYTADGETEPTTIPLTKDARRLLEEGTRKATAEGLSAVTFPGLKKAIPLAEAEDILTVFGEAEKKAEEGEFDPEKPKNRPGGKRPSLLIKPNIQTLDYEETRRELMEVECRFEPIAGLRSDVVLKDHQVAGVAWLQQRFRCAPDICRGAVLGDDMGLGKTLQLLCLISWILERNPAAAPALVVAPASLLENWKDEIQRFFKPGALPLLTAYGDSLSQLKVPRDAIDTQLRQESLVKFLRSGWREKARLVLTTYETVRDFEFSFAAERWSVMVCDEAQKIKNPNALVTRSAKKQNVDFRIACTGTPVENTLTDLWCLFDFIQPGLLGALNEFSTNYRRPVEARSDAERAKVEELRTRIAPQILRRTKSEVAKDLPKKVEVEACRSLKLSAHQQALYGHAVDLYRRRGKEASPFKNHLGLLHYLRLLCTDPVKPRQEAFVAEELSRYAAKSPKLAWLLQTLVEIRGKGEKAIIFCEFREIQRLLRYYIRVALNYDADIVNGDTSAAASHVASRQKRIREFQAKAGFGVLILSPLAVGFGVNIQAANHVIHYTRTWNPAKEDQATDRAYRIGQIKDVFVYCPVVRSDDFKTFDVRLDELLRFKRGLASDMLNGCPEVRPADFDVADVIPGGQDALEESPLTIDDVTRMMGPAFEAFVAALWSKCGWPKVYRTKSSNDGGVDVVALRDSVGEAIQCKASSRDGAQLNVEAVREVVSGSAMYAARHPGVTLTRTAVTNQFFNSNARHHAELNAVRLIEQPELAEMLQKHVVRMHEVERFLTDWHEVSSEAGYETSP
jgi:Holliday junction resolvase